MARGSQGMTPSSSLARVVKASHGAAMREAPPAAPAGPDVITRLGQLPGLDPGVARAWLAAVTLLRPEQWTKNLFIVAPLFFTPPALSLASAAMVAAGVLSFSLLASAIYIVNDYLDREADRNHPTKARRPLAAGTVSVSVALALLILLLAGGFLLALWLSPAFAAVGAAYVAMNLAYSLRLKHVAIVDVLIIALSFVLRVLAGNVLIEVEPSAWILIVSGLLALFLALAKRRDDLVKSLNGEHRRSLAGYSQSFLDTAVAVVLGALLVTYMIYTTDRQVMAELGTERLVYTVLFLIAGVLRYLQITLVENRSGSPTTVVLTDRFLIVTGALWAATLVALIHF
jgi:decaprenyl-phosphate phosphoribosyltransferase